MKPRVLVWFWSGGGGGSQFAARLAHRLTRLLGSDYVSLSMRADDPTIETALGYGVRVQRAEIVSDRRRPIATGLNLLRASATLAEHARDCDVVIAAMNFATAAPLALTLNKPLVFGAHDPKPHAGDYAARLQRITQGVLMRRAKVVLAFSTFTADALQQSGMPRAKLQVAPLSSVWAPRDTRRHPSSGPVRFLFLGRMIDYKGADLLADALRHIADRDDWRLTVAGHGPALTPSLKARFDLPQVEGVRPDLLSEAEINGLLESHDVMLAPYRAASQSGVVAEALAAGMPCIVTPVGALIEQIGAVGGWAAASPTAEAFAACMRTLLDDRASINAKSEGALAVARAAWAAPYWDWLDRDWS